MEKQTFPITVIVHTRDSGRTLERALNSVFLWVDEILVADMSSEDNTRVIAKKFGAKVVRVETMEYADPVRNEVMDQAKSPWILVLDADEEISPTLAITLQELSQDTSVQAYRLPRKNMIFGQWAQTGWWPDYIIRFFQKGSVQWPSEVHGQPVATGITRERPAKEEFAIIHHNYETVAEFVERMNRYTTLELEKKGIVSEHPLKQGTDEFLRRYFAHHGYKQGSYGLSLSLLQGMYAVLTQIKLQEKNGFDQHNAAKAAFAFEHQLDESFRDLCYWIADLHVTLETSPLVRLYWRVRRKLRV
jgi:glycosyltransferase involved in cell wall biosynthesis